MTGDVRFESLSKRYGDVWALRDLSLSLAAGQILAIVGPSGSGKSTLLNLCAGITVPTAGRVLIDGEDITDVPIDERNIGVVFQSYALFPHLSVLENISFSLRTKRHRAPSDVARRRAQEMLHLVGLHDCEHRKPRELSGGEQQRVALARALVFRPRLLLLDEPLGALDPSLKEQLHDDILRLRDELGVTIIYVTHDQLEAMNLADQIAVMHAGRLEQLASPRNVYERPANEFVATFVGEANLIRGRVREVGIGSVCVEVPSGRLWASTGAHRQVGEEVVLLVRPEVIKAAVTESSPELANRVSGMVRRVTFLGAFARVIVETASHTILRISCPCDIADRRFVAGTSVELCWRPADTHIVGSATPRDDGGRALRQFGYAPLAVSREA